MRNHPILARKLVFTLLFWGGLLLEGHLCLGQKHDWPMYFDHLTISEGLSHNTVHCLLQDQYGYIWIGTQNGLNQYDGYGFEVFRSNGEAPGRDGFIGKSITALFEDRAGNLWIGTSSQGINVRRKHQNRFENFQSDTAFTYIKGFEITSFYEDQAGYIWISTLNGGLIKYHPKSGTSQHFTSDNNHLFSNAVFDVVEDQQGTIWVATAGLGVNYLTEGDQFALVEGSPTGQGNLAGFRKTLFLDDDHLWLGTEGSGLYQIAIPSHEITHFPQTNDTNGLSSNTVRDIFKSTDGHLYLATDGGGLSVYGENSGVFTTYNYQVDDKTALNSNALFCFLEDRTGNLWIGTYNGGINIFKPHKTWFDFYSPAFGKGKELANKSILAIHQSDQGKIWVGTDGGGLNWFDQANHRFQLPAFNQSSQNPNSLAGNVIKTLFEDRQGRLWIGLFGVGMDVYDPSTQSILHTGEPNGAPASLTNTNVWSLAERKDGTLWIGTIGSGLHVYDPNTKHVTVHSFDPNRPEGLLEITIMTVFVDQGDQVWIGMADKGLSTWDDDKQSFIHYQHQIDDTASLSNDEVRSIFQDSQGNLWIGTEGGGLNRWLGDGQFERIDTEDGLIANSVMGITEDHEGMIWISTFEGISRFDPQHKTFRNFGFHEGHNANQFNQMAIVTAKDGQLLFGGINGLNAIRPAQIKDKVAQSPILFTDFKVFNTSVPIGHLEDGRTILSDPIEIADQVSLKYYDNSFSFSFATIDYTNPLENQFSYKMEGFDDQWQETSSGQHSVTYTNLDPGRYTFKVKNLEYLTQVAIFIEPPFWKTIWFRTLVTLLLIGLSLGGIYFVIQRREAAHKRQILEANSEILRLKNEKLADEIAAKNSKLMFSSVQMAHKNEMLTTIKNEVTDLEVAHDAKYLGLMRMLDKELKSENYWKEFNLYFNQVDNNFGHSLREKHPGLTQNDMRICALIRINLTTKEIASLLNISSRAVEQSRYRLKKRLGLSKEESLSAYIINFKS